MEEGKIAYAGKYSAPDYETIVSSSCELAVESTMIYHTPEVKEQLERLGIRSSWSGPAMRVIRSGEWSGSASMVF